MFTREDLVKRGLLEFLGDDLCSRWRCVLCCEVVLLRVAMVIGNVCCGRCGMTCLRPWPLELEAVPR